MPYNAQGTWIPEDDSVAPRVAAITASGSPLIRAAEGIGIRTANARGLVNSSIASGAATSAALSAATPIASQEAQQTYGKNVQSMQDKTNAAQIAASDRQALAQQVGAASGDYSQGVANTLQNDKIPAGTRQAVQQSLLDTQNARLAAIQRLYGVDLAWGAAAAQPAQTTYNPAYNT